MDDRLFEKTLGYINYEKYYIPRGYLSEKILYRKVAQKFILDKFLNKWMDNSLDDPVDIIDDMLLKYYGWINDATIDNNLNLLKTYDIYVKTLNELKNYIIKEKR